MLHTDFLKEVRPSDYLIGVDRAAYWLIIHGHIPDIAIGDFDSITSRELAVIKQKAKKVKMYPTQKDATDLELAIDLAISRKPKEVVIYGAIGSRLDHTLVAVHLLENFFKHHIKGILRDRHNEAILVRSRRTIRIVKGYRYLSLLAHTPQAVVTLEHVKYPVIEHAFYRGESLGISNEITGTHASIEVHKGEIIVIRSSDPRRRRRVQDSNL